LIWFLRFFDLIY